MKESPVSAGVGFAGVTSDMWAPRGVNRIVPPPCHDSARAGSPGSDDRPHDRPHDRPRPGQPDRARISSATDHAWNGHPVAPWGASPSVVSETEPSPNS